MAVHRNDLGKVTVLVVDDTEINRRVAGLALGECSVLEAASGKAALDLLRAHAEVDVILLDVMMPGINGYDVCRDIKADARWRLIPVIMLTALNNVEDRVNALQAGADDFISKPYDVIELRARVYNSARAKRYNDQLEETKTILFTLANMVECKDTYTNGHLQRIEQLTETFCGRLGLSQPEQEITRYGGLLHDIGKIAISDTILLKPGRLTTEEFEAMKKHTLVGDNIVSTLRMGKQVAPIVRGHHERWQGQGYPDGLAGEDIPLGARIIGICDVYDALTSPRPYRKRISYAEALQYIEQQSAIDFDPALVEVFSPMIREYL